MAETAFQTQYRQQFIAGFEQNQSLLRDFVTTDGTPKGNSFVFLVADSGDAEAVTRGVNGLIPGRPDNLSQLTCTLQEWHDKPIKTGFNIFASQGDGKRIMQMTSMGVMNRKIDQLIINQLDTATVGATDGAVPATISWVMKGATRLQNAKVPWDNGITFLGSPAAIGYLLQTPEFTKATYVAGRQPLATGEAMWSDKPGFYKWNNITFISHPAVPGVGTADETCYMFHKSAIGHATDVQGIQTFVDYNSEDDYSYCRVTAYMGSKLLQNSGVIVMPHNGLGLSA
jgi:hypothetical protein